MKLCRVTSDYRAVTDLRRKDCWLILENDKVIARLYKKNDNWYVWVEHLKTRKKVRSATEGIEEICKVAKNYKKYQKKERYIS